MRIFILGIDRGDKGRCGLLKQSLRIFLLFLKMLHLGRSQFSHLFDPVIYENHRNYRYDIGEKSRDGNHIVVDDYTDEKPRELKCQKYE